MRSACNEILTLRSATQTPSHPRPCICTGGDENETKRNRPKRESCVETRSSFHYLLPRAAPREGMRAVAAAAAALRAGAGWLYEEQQVMMDG